MESAYRLDADGKAVRVRNGRPCSICSNFDRAEIDRLLLTGTPRKQICEQFNINKQALHNHLYKGHITADVANAVTKRHRMDMDTLSATLEHVILESREKAKSAPIQYYGPAARVTVTATQALTDMSYKAEQLRLERDKAEQGRQKQTFDLASIIDWLRSEVPEKVDAFILRFNVTP
jgi:hypothetical protein